MPRELKDVTIVIIDTSAHRLAHFALKQTFDQITPYRTLIFSDIPSKLLSDNAPPGTLLCPIPVLTGFDDLNMLMWYGVVGHVETSHVLFIQYDGWVLDGSRWNDEWLNYDYIGAPWPWHQDRQVGNGGFSLRSKRLMHFLMSNPDKFPVQHPEDDTLCRNYRPELEWEGFRWTSTEAALDFSFERSPVRSTFGFHGIFNVPRVLGPKNIIPWKACATDYVRNKVEWREISQC